VALFNSNGYVRVLTATCLQLCGFGWQAGSETALAGQQVKHRRRSCQLTIIF
jgi:hypothetical protein